MWDVEGRLNEKIRGTSHKPENNITTKKKRAKDIDKKKAKRVYVSKLSQYAYA